jgi:MtN3 and saliva related transmembrane protein
VDATDFFGVLASVMGVLMALAPLFQVRRVLERGQADDISLTFLAVIAIGASCWCAYGISTGDPYLIVPNTLGVITNVGTLLVVRRYQARSAAAARAT